MFAEVLVMNEKEAKEIIQAEKNSPTTTLERSYLFAQAIGYLKAIEKAGVMEKALKDMELNTQESHGVILSKHSDIVKLVDALREWEKIK